MSALRKALGAPDRRDVTRGRGYVLDASTRRRVRRRPRFERLARPPRARPPWPPTRPAPRRPLCGSRRSARGSGAPLEGLEVEGPCARLELERLTELRLAALENRLEAGLALGRHAGLVRRAAARRGGRAPVPGAARGALLMLALYRSGRHADALARLPRDAPACSTTSSAWSRARACSRAGAPGSSPRTPELDRRAVAPAAPRPPHEPPAPAPAPPRRACARDGPLARGRRPRGAGRAARPGGRLPRVREAARSAVERHSRTLADVGRRRPSSALFGADREVHEDDALRAAARAAVELRGRRSRRIERAPSCSRRRGVHRRDAPAAGRHGRTRSPPRRGCGAAAAGRRGARRGAPAAWRPRFARARRRAPAWRLGASSAPASAPQRPGAIPGRRSWARAGELAPLRAALRGRVSRRLGLPHG